MYKEEEGVFKKLSSINSIPNLKQQASQKKTESELAYAESMVKATQPVVSSNNSTLTPQSIPQATVRATEWHEHGIARDVKNFVNGFFNSGPEAYRITDIKEIDGLKPASPERLGQALGFVVSSMPLVGFVVADLPRSANSIPKDGGESLAWSVGGELLGGVLPLKALKTTTNDVKTMMELNPQKSVADVNEEFFDEFGLEANPLLEIHESGHMYNNFNPDAAGEAAQNGFDKAYLRWFSKEKPELDIVNGPIIRDIADIDERKRLLVALAEEAGVSAPIGSTPDQIIKLFEEKLIQDGRNFARLVEIRWGNAMGAGLSTKELPAILRGEKPNILETVQAEATNLYSLTLEKAKAPIEELDWQLYKLKRKFNGKDLD